MKCLLCGDELGLEADPDQAVCETCGEAMEADPTLKIVAVEILAEEADAVEGIEEVDL